SVSAGLRRAARRRRRVREPRLEAVRGRREPAVRARLDDRLRGEPAGRRLQGREPERRRGLRLRLLLPRRRRGTRLGRLSGSARAVGPCAPYAGVRDELAAIASQQRAAAGSDEFQIVIVIFGTPAWAARSAESCERGGRGTFSRPLSAAGLGAYRALIRTLI